MRISAALFDDGNFVDMAETRFIVEFTPRPLRFQLSLPSACSWTTVQNKLLQGCGLSSTAPAVRITYADKDEMVLLSSESEMLEALRVAANKGNVLEIHITEEAASRPSATMQPLCSAHHSNDSGEFVFFGGKSTSAESVANMDASDPATTSSAVLGAVAGEGGTMPPAWIVEILRTLKKELKDEITADVFKRLDGRKVDMWTAVATVESFPDAPTCSNCHCQAQGVRYRCCVCSNYDLCETCESMPGVHDSSHAMLKIRKPAGLQPAVLGECSNDSTFWPVRSPNSPSAIREMKEQMEMQMFTKHEKYKIRDSIIYTLDGAASSPEEYPSPDSYHSEFICDRIVPNWIHVQPGTRFAMRLRVRNSGSRVWDENIFLKYCWGNLELVPNDMKIKAPRLLPNEEGTLEVQFSVPHRPGRYQSHWRMFSPHGGFGHCLQCNVVADSALALEPKQDHMSSLKVVDRVDDDISHEPVLKAEDFATGPKAETVSHIATTFSTPATVTPQKSPELEKVESSVTAYGSNMSVLDTSIFHNTEQPARVLNLGSVDKAGDFEVVPMPYCADFKASFSVPEPKSSSRGDQSTVLCPVQTSYEVITKPAKYNFHDPLQSIPSPAVAAPQGYSYEVDDNVPVWFQDSLIECDSSSSSATASEVSTFHMSTSCDHKKKRNEANSTEGAENMAKAATKPSFSTRKTYKVEGIGDAIPEALVNGALNAAATVYSTVKTVFSGIQQEKQRIGLPQWEPTTTCLAPQNRLLGMGFRNRELNLALQAKQTGNIQNLTEELMNANAESWSTARPMEGPPTARSFMSPFE